MTQRAIPFLFIRGGSSRGPYMRREDLPQDQEALAMVLVAWAHVGFSHRDDRMAGRRARRAEKMLLQLIEGIVVVVQGTGQAVAAFL